MFYGMEMEIFQIEKIYVVHGFVRLLSFARIHDQNSTRQRQLNSSLIF